MRFEPPLADDVRVPLLGEDNALRRLLDLAMAYEKGEWDVVTSRASALSLPIALGAEMYRQSVGWGDAASALNERAGR